MKDKVLGKLLDALKELNLPTDTIIIQNSKNPEHGDFATNIAMILAVKLKQLPRQIADKIIIKLQELNSDNFFSDIAKAGPGFINFKIKATQYSKNLMTIINLGDDFGKSSVGNGKKRLLNLLVQILQVLYMLGIAEELYLAMFYPIF